MNSESSREIQVLLVDDDSDVLNTLAEYLEEAHGCKVRKARTRTEALEWMQRDGSYIDVALIDERLPNDSGIEVMHVIKLNYPHLPVIIFTGFEDEEAGERALRAGAYRYIEKSDGRDFRRYLRELGLQVRLAAEHGRLARQRDVFRRLLDISRSILSYPTLDDVLQAIAEGVRELTGFRIVRVSEIDEDGNVRHVGVVGLDEDQIREIRRTRRSWNKVYRPLFEDAERLGYKKGEASYFIPAEAPIEPTRYGLRAVDEGSSQEHQGDFWHWHPSDMLETIIKDERGNPIGLIGVGAPADDLRPTAETIEILELLAHQAAIAITRARTLHDLLEATAKIHSARSLKEALDTIAEQAARLLHTDAGGVLLLNRNDQYLYFKGSYELSDRIVNETREQIGTSIAGRVVQDGKPRICNDVPLSKEQGEFYNPAAEGEALLSIISVPIVHEGETQPIGTLDAQSKTRKGAFKKEDIPLLELMARHAALAIDKARFVEALEKVSAVARTFAQGARESQRQKDILQEVVQQVAQIFEADCVVLYPLDARGERFDVERVVAYGLQDEAGFRERLDAEVRNPNENAAFYVLQRGLVVVENLDDKNEPEREWFYRRKFIQKEGIKAFMATPLRSIEQSDAALGVIFVNYRSPQKFREWEKDILQLIASFGSVGLRSAHYRRRQQQELEAMAEVVRTITTAEDIEEVWGEILKIAAEVTASEYGAFIRRDEKGSLTTEYTYGVSKDEFRKSDAELAIKGIVGWVARQGKSVLAINIPENSDWKDIYVKGIKGVQCELAVPAHYGSELLGIIDLESPRPYAFTENDKRFVENLARVAAITLHMARTYDRLQRTHQILNGLYRSTVEAMTEKTEERNEENKEPIDALLDALLEQAASATGADFAILMVHDPYDHALVFTRFWPIQDYPALVALEHRVFLPDPALDRDGQTRGRKGITGRVFLTGEPALVDDVSQDPDYVNYTDETKSELAVPVKDRDGKVIAVLNVESRRYAAFHKADVDTLNYFAARIGELLQQQREQEAVQANFVAAQWGLIYSTAIHDVSREIGRLQMELYMLTEDDNTPEDMRTQLRAIREITRKIKEDILSDTRIEQSEHLALKPLLEDVCPRLAKKYALSLSLETEGIGAGTKVMANKYWVNWVLKQLFENAVEAMGNQEDRRIEVRARQVAQAVVIEVENNGPEIPESVRRKLFKARVTTKNDSTGGALLLARTVLRGFGGDLRLQSTGPEGTIFAILLPSSEQQA